MSAVDAAMNFACAVNFLALILLLHAIWKDRNRLKGYSMYGSLLTFISMCGFEVAYYLMNNMVSFVLSLSAVSFWLLAFIYTLKQKIRTEESN